MLGFRKTKRASENLENDNMTNQFDLMMFISIVYISMCGTTTQGLASRALSCFCGNESPSESL